MELVSVNDRCYKIPDRRNMEPLDVLSVCKGSRILALQIIDSKTVAFAHSTEGKVQLSILTIEKQYLVRIRGGGGDDINNDSKFNDIPALTRLNFMWNGLPCIDFDENVLNIFDAGLGSISSDGDTLLDTVNRTDAGGVLGAPPRAAASAAIVRKSDNRNKRAFSCILNYIMSTSAVYKLFMRDFRRNGIAVYSFIQAFGPLPAPPRIVRARDDAWSRMTMDALRIPYTLTGYFRWTELVQEQARKLGKDGTKQKEKFIDGLPSFFNTEKTAMRHDTRFVFPPLYGAIPGYAASPLAATPHPFAGQPDIDAMSRGYVPDWITRSAAAASKVPSGLVRAITEEELLCEACESESVNLAAKDVTRKTKCHTCNGEGHATWQTLEDGTKVECASKTLGTLGGSSKELFMPAPAGFENPSDRARGDRYKTKSLEYKNQINELTEQLSEIKRNFTRRRSISPRPNRSASSLVDSDISSEHGNTDSDNDNTAHSVDDSTDANDKSEQSDDSDGSAISAFAANPSFRNKKRFVPRKK